MLAPEIKKTGTYPTRKSGFGRRFERVSNRVIGVLLSSTTWETGTTLLQ